MHGMPVVGINYETLIRSRQEEFLLTFTIVNSYRTRSHKTDDRVLGEKMPVTTSNGARCVLDIEYPLDGKGKPLLNIVQNGETASTVPKTLQVYEGSH